MAKSTEMHLHLSFDLRQDYRVGVQVVVSSTVGVAHDVSHGRYHLKRNVNSNIHGHRLVAHKGAERLSFKVLRRHVRHFPSKIAERSCAVWFGICGVRQFTQHGKFPNGAILHQHTAVVVVVNRQVHVC